MQCWLCRPFGFSSWCRGLKHRVAFEGVAAQACLPSVQRRRLLVEQSVDDVLETECSRLEGVARSGDVGHATWLLEAAFASHAG
eukprot:817327-Amphidinium_carterae.1